MKSQVKKSLTIITLALLTVVLALCLFSCGPEQYTVTFDADGGNEVATQIVEEGKNAQKPENPTKEGYNFLGWYAGDEEWSFVGFPVNDNIILKAKWEKKTYTVTFDANGGNGSTEKTVQHGSKASAPMVSKPNYSLIGWFNGDTQWSFDNKITSDITLTAKWEGFPKKITFDANGGTATEEERNVPYGSEIGILPLPEKDNFKFLGWFDSNDVDMENRIKKTTIVEGNMTLVAKWEMNTSLVSIEFDTNGGTLAKDVVYINKGEALGDLLVDPTRSDGATFLGWYDARGNRITKTTQFTSNGILKAKWIEPVICTNGTYTHSWSPWDYEAVKPTCTEDGQATRICADCQHRETKPGEEKLGHSFSGGWKYGTMQQSRQCKRCEREEVIYYTNLTSKVKEATVSGSVFGAENVDCLFNDNWNETAGTFCGRGQTITVDIELTEATYMDCMFIKGVGGYTYNVYALLEGKSQYTYLGNGAFEEEAHRVAVFDRVTKVRIVMDYSGNLDGYWQEIAFAEIPEIDN